MLSRLWVVVLGHLDRSFVNWSYQMKSQGYCTVVCGKLPIEVKGNTRNSIIASFQQWKGGHYVPSTVHNSIRWMTRNSWLESKNIDLDEQLAQLERTKQKRSKEKHAFTKTGKFGLTVAKKGLGDGSTQKTSSTPSGLP
jgi:hypothetical protein